MTAMPRSGVVYRVGAECGVPFNFRPILFTLSHIEEHLPHAGTAHLVGYEVDERGQAIEKRRIYIILAGLQPAARVLNPRHAEHRNTAGAWLPRPRISPETTRRNR